ncbi:hypothetical protein [Marinicrinis sediminis]|uniref:DUF4440 domain-containing protein n=1 Tax=Marinicrinis sediminis TaxID=1652465 RepID=A0ABW5RDK6_9BACL
MKYLQVIVFGLMLAVVADCSNTDNAAGNEQPQANQQEEGQVDNEQPVEQGEETDNPAEKEEPMTSEQAEQEEPMTSEQAEQVLVQYEQVFMETGKDYDDQFKIEGYSSMQDILDEYETIMTEAWAVGTADIHFEQREDGVYLKPTELPVFLETEQPFEVNQADENTVEVIQQQESDLRGNMQVTFTLVKQEEQWKLQSTHLERQ